MRHNCTICSNQKVTLPPETAVFKIKVVNMTTGRSQTEFRCVDCAHDVCVVGRNDIEKLSKPKKKRC